MSGEPLLRVEGLRMHFFTKAGVVKACLLYTSPSPRDS